MPKSGFNWQGITENTDGTFTTSGKREKTRLLKEFHRQGIAVRSRKNSDGSFIVSPVGSISRRLRSSRPIRVRPNYSGGGYRPASRYKESTYPRFPQGSGRTSPAYRSPGRGVMMGPPPRMGLGAGGGGGARPRPKGESLFQKVIKSHKDRRLKDEEFKKNARETNEKMRQDRINQERQETANEINRQAEKRRLLQESAAHERHEQAEKMKRTMGQPMKRTMGQPDERHRPNLSQIRDYDRFIQRSQPSGSSRTESSTPQKTEKMDQAQLSIARENVVKGDRE